MAYPTTTSFSKETVLGTLEALQALVRLQMIVFTKHLVSYQKAAKHMVVTSPTIMDTGFAQLNKTFEVYSQKLLDKTECFKDDFSMDNVKKNG